MQTAEKKKITFNKLEGSLLLEILTRIWLREKTSAARRRREKKKENPSKLQISGAAGMRVAARLFSHTKGVTRSLSSVPTSLKKSLFFLDFSTPKPLKHHLSTFYPQLGCSSGEPPLATPLQRLQPCRARQDLCARLQWRGFIYAVSLFTSKDVLTMLSFRLKFQISIPDQTLYHFF